MVGVKDRDPTKVLGEGLYVDESAETLETATVYNQRVRPTGVPVDGVHEERERPIVTESRIDTTTGTPNP